MLLLSSSVQSYILSLCTVGAECGHWSKPCAVLCSLAKSSTSVYPTRWWLCGIVMFYSLLCSGRLLCGRILFSFGASKGSYQTLPAFLPYHFGRWALTSDVSKWIDAIYDNFQKFGVVRMWAFVPSHRHSVRQRGRSLWFLRVSEMAAGCRSLIHNHVLRSWKTGTPFT